MAAQKPCSKLQSFFMTEGKKLVKRWMKGEAGDKVEAQIANAAIELDMPYQACWRAYQGRCGERLFPKLYEAERAALKRKAHEDKAVQILERLDRVERTLAEVTDRLTDAHRERAEQADPEIEPANALGVAA